MTAKLARLFRAAGCNPECHACGRKIKSGRKFKLASLDGTDEMLCVRCTPENLKAKKGLKRLAEQALQERYLSTSRRSFGGYSRPTRKHDLK